MAATTAGQANQQRAARDIAVQVFARLANLALGVLVTALLARTLGSAGYGQWATILAVLGLTGYFANFGMEGVVVREAAREPEHEGEWLGAAMLLRLILLGPVVVLSLLAVLLLQESHQMLLAGVVLILGMPFDGVGAMQLVFQLRIKNTVPMLVLTIRERAVGGGRGGSSSGAAATWSRWRSRWRSRTPVGRRAGARGAAADRALAAPLAQAPGAARARGCPAGNLGGLITAYANIDQVIVFELAGGGGRPVRRRLPRPGTGALRPDLGPDDDDADHGRLMAAGSRADAARRGGDGRADGGRLVRRARVRDGRGGAADTPDLRCSGSAPRRPRCRCCSARSCSSASATSTATC